MAPVSIRPRTPDDDPQIVDIVNRAYPEHPPLTLERFRHHVEMASKDPRDHEERYVADQDGAVAGQLIVEKQWWLAGFDIWWASIKVDPSCWGRGIGSRLYDLLMERMGELGGRRLYGEIREDLPRADRFVSRRGFNRTGHSDRLSRLDVRVAKLDGYFGIEQQLRDLGIEITTLAEAGADDEVLLRRVHALESATIKDIPSSEEHVEDWPFELWREEMLHGPGRRTDAFFLALAGGQPVGVARLTVEPGRDWAFNSYTCVDRAHRGRGLARSLKLRTIEWARQNGLTYIYTGNDVDNRRMLDINIRLGYQPLPSEVEVVKEL
jgi:GNAT superfamily N-acetyltransferase